MFETLYSVAITPLNAGNIYWLYKLYILYTIHYCKCW